MTAYPKLTHRPAPRRHLRLRPDSILSVVLALAFSAAFWALIVLTALNPLR